jgi:hypothetical protein
VSKIVGWLCASALALLCGAGPAAASPIGVFGFVVDPGLGPILSVENTSGDGAFTNIAVHLFDGTTGLLDFSLQDVAPFDPPALSFVDLTGLTFDRATLDLSYSVAGSLALHDLVGLSFAFDPLLHIPDPFDPTAFTVGGWFGSSTSVAIDFTPISSPEPVPEPATLLLLGTGLVGVVRAQRRARRINR